MTAAKLLDRLQAAGLCVVLEGDHLRASGPSEAINHSRDTLRRNKTEIVSHLRAKATAEKPRQGEPGQTHQPHAGDFDSPPIVTCSACRHWQPDPINPQQGLGRCLARDHEPKPLPWPHAPRRCRKFQPRD